MTEPLTGAEIEELDALMELTRTRGWKYFKNLLHTHEQYCLKKSKDALEDYKDREAGEWLARSKEKNKIMNLIESRKKEISQRREREM